MKRKGDAIVNQNMFETLVEQKQQEKRNKSNVIIEFIYLFIYCVHND